MTKAQEKKLIEALRWYASSEAWEWFMNVSYPGGKQHREIDLDNGRRAREALKASNDSHSMGCYEDRQSVWHCDAACPIRSRISQEGQPK